MTKKSARRRILGAAAALAAGACATSPRSMSVRALPAQYSPAMSSTVGIGLRPVFVPPSGTVVDYHWRTNFGYFLTWGAPDYKPARQGADVFLTEGQLYWSYDPSRAMTRKPPVAIVIEARDRQSGRVLARRTVRLDWDQDVARVRD